MELSSGVTQIPGTDSGGTNSNEQALPIVRLSQSSLLRLRIPVPEDDVRYVTSATSCRCVSTLSAGRLPARSCDLPRSEFRNPNHGDRSGCGEQGSVHLARHVCQHAIAIGACDKRRHDPVEALVLNSQQETVYALDGSITFTFVMSRWPAGIQTCRDHQRAQPRRSSGDRRTGQVPGKREVNALDTPEPASETVQETAA